MNKLCLYEEAKLDVTDKSLHLILIRLIDAKHPTMYIIPASAWNDSGKPCSFRVTMKENLPQSMALICQRKPPKIGITKSKIQ